MEQRSSLPLLVLASIVSAFVTACASPPQEKGSDAVSSSSSLPGASSSTPFRETHNVAYEGTIRPAGISIYMEGTHRLSLENGKFVLLESESFDLNGYVDERVRIFGSLRPTVEAGGMIMRVERVELLREDSEETEESEDTEDTEEPEDTDDETTQSSSSSSESSEPSESSSSSSVLPEQPAKTNAAKESRIVYMSEQDYAAPQWTQKYCTSHIGFCIPVHRNFWYKSFGATASALWHVEINSEPIERLGDGPIALRLLPGAKAEQDKAVVTQGSSVVGYRTWTDNRHFEVSADSRLRAAVEYIIDNFEQVSGD